MMNKISVAQTAETLRISETDAIELLLHHHIIPIDGMIGFDQAEQFLERVQNTPELGEKKARGNLERVAARYTIVFDTCAILNAQFPVLFTRLLPLLRANGKCAVIPVEVDRELKHLFLNRRELRAQISSAYSLLESAEREGLVEILGNSDHSFGDQQLLTLVMSMRTKEELLVVTFDRKLSDDLLNLNMTASVQGYRVAVSRISPYGYLSRYTAHEPAEHIFAPAV